MSLKYVNMCIELKVCNCKVFKKDYLKEELKTV